MTDLDCTCPHGEVAGGVLYGINMGRHIARLATTPGCPSHDSCQRYTAENRAIYDNGAWLYCPIHGVRDCPRRVASSSPCRKACGAATNRGGRPFALESEG